MEQFSGDRLTNQVSQSCQFHQQSVVKCADYAGELGIEIGDRTG